MRQETRKKWPGDSLARIAAISAATNRQAAVSELLAGHCVAIPTETVYGLAADATNGIAVASIFAMKGRPRFNPLICHVDTMKMAQSIGDFDEVSRKLADAFWPGPLTLVVLRRAGSNVHDLVTADLDSVAIRMPAGPSRGIITALGKPLAAPSANRSGRISPTSAQHVADEFADSDLLILDAGPARVGLESTIARVEGDQIILLRPGGVSAEQLQEAGGLPVVLAARDGPIVAPGMLKSHYAPDARVMLNATECPPDAALLAFGSGDGKDRSRASSIQNLSPTGDLAEAAANLYSMMKELDGKGPSVIAVEPVPFDGLGLAINDRLIRAAAPRNAEDNNHGA
ncbi:MAG: threonylcarbamoyl-AMP synthase [Nitratireductor sp.]|nr:threonylcarbamoyl-AMP synthase [Nitratireductor sp.]